MRRITDSYDDKVFQEYTQSLPQPKKANLKSSSFKSNEDVENIILQQIKSRSTWERSYLNLVKSRLDFEQAREERHEVLLQCKWESN